MLYIDDDAAARTAFVGLAGGRGYAVDAAATANEAMALAARAEYGVIATDYQMPRVNGLQLLGQLRALQPDAAYVLVTGFGEDALAQVDGVSRALSSVVYKPWDSEELGSAIDNAFQIHARRRAEPGIVRVLVVEDNPGDAALVEAALRDAELGFRVVQVGELGHALQRVGGGDFAAAVVDLTLPDARGLDVITHLHARAPELPIVALTGLDDDALAMQALRAGAQDYLVKGEVSGDRLGRAVRYAIERGESERQLVARAHMDPLTGLANSATLRQRLTSALARARRAHSRCALLLVDLDRFKPINDSLGHLAGDAVLRAVAGRLRDAARTEELVARLGGDEFAVVLEDIASSQDAVAVAERIVAAIRQSIDLPEGEVRITASVGIALYPDDSDTAESLLRTADFAMYGAKERGRDGYRFHSGEVHARVARQSALERDLLSALARDQVHLWYQPQYDLRGGQLCAIEAQARWSHPELGDVGDDELAALLDRSGVMRDACPWILRMACEQLRAAQRAGVPVHSVGINLSERQLAEPGLVGTVREILADTGLAPGALVIEVAETVLARDLVGGPIALRRLREVGVGLALDELGRGGSSLALLRGVPWTEIKIDRSFGRAWGNREDAAVVRAIIELAHRLHLTCVAAGVDSHEQLSFLRAAGCDRIQGSLCGPPAPPTVLPKLSHWLD